MNDTARVEYTKKAEEALEEALVPYRDSIDRRDYIHIAQVYATLAVAASTYEAQGFTFDRSRVPAQEPQ